MGMPKTQIMVGIPTFGHSWVLQNPARWQVASMATGPGRRGGGYVSFPEVCSLLQSGAKREYDNESKVPFLHKGKLWISYDDMDSVARKAAWIRSNGYGGTMTFSLGTDDWTGKCGYGTFPLQNAIAYPKNDNRSEQFY
ncbi:hypothetical protein HPB50_024868 [Hyalomma asiaticum]|uniref:Uncharacterized protein n=1 Tax=Hyalomma asiaticum TaxID=266040 RepID=A0ACB7RLD0_HYAAI|nr:hypothetical protein HPB50_024868 [Hyalomma asiaticum]